jgi:tRNA (cmo5U34)-methyltransferase
LVKYDLNEGIPGGFVPGSFNAVVSCFVLHHIEFERRVPLYAQAYTLLKEGGRLIIADRFAEESAEINEWMFDAWVRFMTQQGKEKLGYSLTFEQMKSRQIYSDRKLGDKPGSIWAIERDLRTAGFSHVDCIYKNQIIAALVAVK